MSSNYNIYRCPDPLKYKVDQPWFRINDTCPCDPTLNNLTGRGWMSCPFGIEEDLATPQQRSSTKQYPWTTNINFTEPVVQQRYNIETSQVATVPKGALFQSGNITPPQLQPRPLSRIGTAWRSAY